MRDLKEYRIANSPAEAVAMLKAGPGKGCFVAGGTDLRIADCRCDYLVDITQAGLTGIDSSEQGDVFIGSTTSLQDCLCNGVLEEFAGGVISKVAGQCGDLSVRNKATLGGNLCNALPSADMAPVLLALDAVCIILDEESQEMVPLAEFFEAPRRTVLKNRLLAGVVLQGEVAHWRCRFYRLTRSAVDVPLVQVAVALEVTEGVIAQARVALGAVAPVPMRSQLAEAFLVDQKLAEITPEMVEDVALLAASECDPVDDDLASAEYRTDMVRVLTRRMICQVLAKEGVIDCSEAEHTDGNDGGAA